MSSRSTDDEVVRIVAESDDPVAAVGQCLRIGARALRAAHVTVDVDVIERSFSELETRFESPASPTRSTRSPAPPAVCSTTRTARSSGTLTTFRTEFDQLLGDTFDATPRSSVIAKIEELVLATMKGLITPEIDDSPIGRLKTELVDTVQREVGDVADEVRRVTEHLGILDATEDVYEQTTGKGFDYEDFVDECVGHARRRLRRPRRGAPPTSRDRARRRWATRSSRSTATTRTASRPASCSR